MADTTPFSALMEQLRSGEDGAAREVFRRYSRRLIGLARGRIAGRLAHRVDPEDVVQSAFKSFFLRHREGTLRPDDWDDLWGLLALITLRKCVDRVDYLRAGRRDVRREATTLEEQGTPWQIALDRGPCPEESAILAEAVEGLFRAVGAEDRPILEMTLQGYTSAEIGLRLGRALRSVQRLREQVRKRLERHALEGLEFGV